MLPDHACVCWVMACARSKRRCLRRTWRYMEQSLPQRPRKNITMLGAVSSLAAIVQCTWTPPSGFCRCRNQFADGVPRPLPMPAQLASSLSDCYALYRHFFTLGTLEVCGTALVPSKQKRRSFSGYKLGGAFCWVFFLQGIETCVVVGGLAPER